MYTSRFSRAFSLLKPLQLAVGLRVVRRAADMPNGQHPRIVLEGVPQIARPVVGDEPCAILDRHVPHPLPLHHLLDQVVSSFFLTFVEV
jgi:hypothetical protein